ncbi:hypothetical protein GGI43DRAFT_3088 [Trichoderma evansii]
MDNQVSPNGRLSRDSSISLEDHNGPAPRLSRSDLYTAHQRQREANDQASLDSLFMIPLDLPALDLPATYNTYETHPGMGTSDSADEPPLSACHLEHYLSEEHRHERIALGEQPLTVNKATVQNYLPEIIQSVDNSASQAEATVGTITEPDEGELNEAEPDEVEPDEGVCWGSFTTLTSTTSDGSLEAIRVCDNNNDGDCLAEATDSRLLHPTPSLDQHIAPSLARLGKTDATPIKSQRALTGNEFHLIAQDAGEQYLELDGIVRDQIRMSSRNNNRHGRYRVEKQARVKKIVRQRKRSKEPLEMTK